MQRHLLIRKLQVVTMGVSLAVMFMFPTVSLACSDCLACKTRRAMELSEAISFFTTN